VPSAVFDSWVGGAVGQGGRAGSSSGAVSGPRGRASSDANVPSVGFDSIVGVAVGQGDASCAPSARPPPTPSPVRAKMPSGVDLLPASQTHQPSALAPEQAPSPAWAQQARLPPALALEQAPPPAFTLQSGPLLALALTRQPTPSGVNGSPDSTERTPLALPSTPRLLTPDGRERF
jgi:hypothetical protein